MLLAYVCMLFYNSLLLNNFVFGLAAAYIKKGSISTIKHQETKTYSKHRTITKHKDPEKSAK